MQSSSTSPFDYTPAWRQSFTEQRPHTVHAASSSSVILEEAEDFLSDNDTTPRASAAGLSAAHADISRRRLSRDDTANDMHILAAAAAASTSSAKVRWSSAIEGIAPEEQDTRSSIAEEPRMDSQRLYKRSPRSRHLSRLSSSGNANGLAENANAISAGPSGFHGQHSEKNPSLGRRLSIRYGGLRESVTQKITAASNARVRRSSTPQRMDETACIDPAMLSLERPPTSPSKRTAAQNSQPRKHRHFLPTSDRKDTPAPATYALGQGLPVRPASSRNVPIMGTAPGGEAARAAAAKYNNHSISPTSFTPADFEESEDYIPRHRLGSLSSAADSGADLSTYSGSDAENCARDLDGDTNMTDIIHSDNQDFLTSKLPTELALQVFSQLDVVDLVNAARVNRKWKALTDDPGVWRTVFLRRYQRRITTSPAPIQVGGIGVGRPNKPRQRWRDMYEARVELDKNWRKGAEKAGKAIYLSGHTDSVYCLQFDEEKIITGSRDRTIRVWDINTYQCLRVIGGPNVKPVLGPKQLRTVDYPNFHMATASVNGTAYGDGIYHVPREWHDASILCLQYDEKILVTGSSDSDLLVWDIKTYEPIRRLRKHAGGVLDVALDAKHIVSCSKDSKIIVWDRETFEPKGELTGHRGPVNAVQLRGHLLVSASGDGIARLWDLNKMKLMKEFSAKERGLAAVEFSEDMEYVLAGGNDNITYKFETQTGREVMQFNGHTQLVRSLWLDSANNRVVSGSYDLDLRVYDFITGQELWRGEEWTTSWMLAAKSDYRRIVATSQDGRILMVDFGIIKGQPHFKSLDGEKIPNIDLLRGTDETSEIQFRPIPWTGRPRRDSPRM